MPRPTGRGYAILGLAVGTYLTGRVIGTWELYLIAFAFAALLVISWLSVILTGRRVRTTRSLVPERPVAGDEPEYVVTVRNASLLPGPQLTLHTGTEGLSDSDLEAEVGSLAPRGQRILRDRMGKVARGIHILPVMEAVAEDPLGIAAAGHRVGDTMTVIVYPRIAHLRSCVFHPELGLRQDWTGQKRMATPGASEFRGVRPHQPGEPLSHIDWKSTAKTGTLMIREMEEPAGSDIAVLLDGTAAQVVGTPPDTNYELAVRAAGSIADYALRMGRGVTLITHESERRQVRLTPDGGGRRTLLETLAEARPNAMGSLALGLRGLLSDRMAPLRSQSLTLVGMTLDQQMARALVGLREDGVNLNFVYVPGFSFTGRDRLLPFLPPSEGGREPEGPRRRGRRGAAGEAGGAPASDPRRSTAQLPVGTRSLLLQLSTAGIRCLTLSWGDDLVRTLSVWQPGRRDRAAAGW